MYIISFKRFLNRFQIDAHSPAKKAGLKEYFDLIIGITNDNYFVKIYLQGRMI